MRGFCVSCQPHNPFSRIDALIVLYQALLDRAVEGGERVRYRAYCWWTARRPILAFWLMLADAYFILLQGDGLAAQQPFVALHLGRQRFRRQPCSAASCREIFPRVDGGNQLSFPDPLSFHYRKVDDLYALTRNASFHIFHRFHHAGEILVLPTVNLRWRFSQVAPRGISSPFLLPAGRDDKCHRPGRTDTFSSFVFD